MSGNPFDSPASGGFDASSKPSPIASIISLIAGVLTFVPGCCCGLVGIPFALIAVVTGVVALVLAKQGKASGQGMAIAGIVCGSIYLLLLVVAVILNISGVLEQNILRPQFEEMR